MRKKKLLLIIPAALLIIVFFALFLLYRISDPVIDKSRFYVIADDGARFKIVYRLLNIPDESYDILIKGKSGDSTYIFSGDGRGSQDIQIEYLGESGDYRYYNAIMRDDYSEMDPERIFVCTRKEKLRIRTDGSYIESYSDLVLFRPYKDENRYKVFLPLAKIQILRKYGDYVIDYADILIQEGNTEILDQIRYFVDNPDDFKYEYYTKEEILAKCDELLQKYGDVQ